MHETSLMKNLLSQIEAIARDHGASHVVDITLRAGTLTGVSPDHLREHFIDAARGTVAEGATLHFIQEDDPNDPAGALRIDSLTVL